MTARDALAAMRADVEKANSPSPVSNRYGAELRIVERHAPAMLRALEAVLEKHQPEWTVYGYYHCREDHELLNDRKANCSTADAIETALEGR